MTATNEPSESRRFFLASSALATAGALSATDAAAQAANA